MKIVTSMTVLTTAEGKRISLTFSEVDAGGSIIKENERVNRVVIDTDALASIASLEEFARGIVEGM